MFCWYTKHSYILRGSSHVPSYLFYIMTKLICKNSQLFFPAVCWLCAYPAAFQWLLLRFDLILHPLVAEKNASHDQLYSKTDFIAIGWDSLSLTISIGSSISWPHDQFDGFLSRLLPPSYTSRINRGLGRCNRHVKIDIFWGRNIQWKLFH